MTHAAYSFLEEVAKSGRLRWRLAMSFFITAIHILALLVQPIFVASIIREIATKADADVRMGVVFLVLAMGFSAVMAYCVAWLNNSVLQDVRRETKSVLYASVLAKPPRFFQHRNEGWMEASIAMASLAARTITHDCLGALIRAVFFILFSAVLIFMELPLYGLVFFAAAIAYLYMAYYLASRSSQAVVAAVVATTSASKEAFDMLSNIEAIQGSDMHWYEKERLLYFLNEERLIHRRGQGLLDKNDFLQKLFLTVIFIFFVTSVAVTAKNDTATAIMFYIIGLMAYAQLDLVGKSLNALFEQVHKLEAVLEKIDFQKIDRKESMSTEVGNEIMRPFSINIDRVSFSYGDGRPIFSNISEDLAPGSHHLITGASGVGKSTLLKIMTGVIKPQSGQVWFGERSVSDISLEEKSLLMSVIPQHATLFNRSIYENATYGVSDVSYPSLENLLLSLKLDRLQREGREHWLDATVDKNGLNLSGGEKQRILLARAILRARPLLFLDEGTSALDKATETEVLKVLHARLPQATIVVVSHHPHAELAGYRTLSLA